MVADINMLEQMLDRRYRAWGGWVAPVTLPALTWRSPYELSLSPQDPGHDLLCMAPTRPLADVTHLHGRPTSTPDESVLTTKGTST